MTLATLFLVACTDKAPTETGETADTGETGGPATLALSFQMEDDYLKSMKEPAIGTFRGSVYAEADASAIGPNDGSEPLFDLAVDDVDLTAGGGPTGVMYTSDPLEPQIVWILGCLDTDGNDCETHDPITVPNENKVEVVAGAETPFTVYFGMLNPQ